MMKKSTSIKTLTRRAAMTLLSMFMLTASTAWAQDAIGGIEYNADGGYYVIDEPDDLRDLATYVNGTGTYRNNSTESTAHDCSGLKFKMTQDIKFTYTEAWNNATSTENNFVAIGGYYNSNNSYFRGHFDGAGYTISGIRIHRSGNATADKYQGIFGQISGANIHGLRLADTRITGYDNTGGIVGDNNGGSTVTDCHVANNVCIHAVQTDAYHHGGIAGRNLGGTYVDCTVANCTSAATLTIADGATKCQYYGAIAGYNGYRGILRDNLAIGATVPATTENYHGAITGDNYGATLQRNYYTACTVAGEANATNAGCKAADVTSNDGAVSVHTITLGEGITITSPDKPTVSYGGTDYYAQGKTITLGYAAPVPAGYQYSYTASAGTLDGSTLTMPDQDVTISLGALAVIPWAGTGDASSPYIIEYPSQLDLLAHRVNGTNGEAAVEDGYSGKYFHLANDIAYTYNKAWNDATSEDNNFEPIGGYYGTNNRYFKGDFDGAGCTVSGIRIHRSGSDDADKYQGIFGRTDGATIHGLRLANARITGYAHTGGIVGYNKGSTVTDCHVASDVCIHAAQTYVYFHGGIAGYNHGGTIEGCTSAATLTISSATSDRQYYGAIAGYNNGTLRDNLAIGATVPAADGRHGTIVGRNYDGTLQRNYYTACKVAGVENATGKGCQNADITANDGAVPALRDQADNAQAIALFAALASTDGGHTPVDLGWGAGQFPLQLAGRTLYKDGSWNTLCLPIDVTLSGSVLDGDGVEVKTLESSAFDAGTLTMNFSEASPTTLTAGTPYIIRWTKPAGYDDTPSAFDLADPVFQSVTASSTAAATATSEYVDFIGTYAPATIYEDGTEKHNLYLGNGNTLYYPTATGFTVNALRGYFRLKNGLTAGEPADPSAGVRAFNLNFGDEETGITTTDFTDSTDKSAAWYDLNGRKLSGKPTQKGIYINNGKKVIIK